MPEIRMIPVDLIDPHPHNPRRDLGDLTELADSIKAHGIRQNLLHTEGHPMIARLARLLWALIAPRYEATRRALTEEGQL